VLAWLLADAYGVVGAAMAWLPATGMAQLVGIMLLRRILPRPFKDVGTPLGTIAIVSCIAAFAVAGVDHMIPGILGLFLASLTGVGLVAGLLWILERRFALGISDGLVKAFPRAAMFLGFPNG
jgi:O-antigen/teichoic acid export membrane protein